MELLQNLGIDWKLLIAQLINFVILLAILYKFLYKPVLKILHTRSEKIEQSLKNADEVEQRLKSATEMYDAKIISARQQAQSILESVQKEADLQRISLIQKAQAEAEAILKNGQKRLAADKEKMLRSAEEELVDLIASATENVLGDIITPDIDEQLIEQAMSKARIGRA